jgi:DNA-binding response OmpR family regulator
MNNLILIVDDSLTVRSDLEEAFADEQMETISCATIAAARAMLEEEPIGLIVLDVLLPDGDGISLLKEVRATPRLAELPVLILSTEAEVRDRIRGLTTGSNDYVGKPYEREYVIARARELLKLGKDDGKKQNQCATYR